MLSFEKTWGSDQDPGQLEALTFPYSPWLWDQPRVEAKGLPNSLLNSVTMSWSCQDSSLATATGSLGQE